MSGYRDAIDYINKEIYYGGTTSLQLLLEDYMTYHNTLMFKEFSPFFEIYNEVQLLMESNGLTEEWRREHTVDRTETEEFGPQVLTMDNLTTGSWYVLFLQF